MPLKLSAALLAGLLAASPALARADTVQTVSGLSMYGTPKYGPGFTHFDYVNPNAPKGGTVRLAALGTYDSFNPFIVKGLPAAGIDQTFDTLLASSADEPFSEYGLVAESMEVPPDRGWVVFNLRPQARFHDGSPITADDVLFSFQILRAKGSPNYRAYYQNVVKAEKLADRKVRFTFAPGDNRELPLILGQLPILSQKYWRHRAFDQTSLEPPLGSGPYQVASFDAGKRVVLQRVKNYWAKDLPVNRGLYNFDRIQIDYYRDSTVALEAFKAGDYDYRPENESKKWATAYDFPAVRNGEALVRTFPNQRPTGMQGYVFNLRRPLFRDDRVRNALTYAFDFEWTNKNLFYGQYQRTASYFSNSDLAAAGLPQGEELKVLEPLKTEIPPQVFTTVYQPPGTDGSDYGVRKNLHIAAALLHQAGWVVKDGRLVNGATGQPFRFEILLDQPVWERITLPFVQNLKRLGISASVRTVDSAQYKNRLDNFDFDMVVDVKPESLSPGNEQREFWGSASADQPGSANLAGVKNPAVDQLIASLVAAPDRAALVARAHALDRVLLWNHYMIPHWHIGYDRVAFWNMFGMPPTVPRQGVQFSAWWIDPVRAATLATRRKH
ncbi:oligopeptide-binding protein AppA precursor [mine drainage metagenome]|uniref:Oligopeptide-binding protein AppA n=1 Tax=mine drainage metagenome TaxID=410659 RepID=A0A1J5REA4_9ZZZZ